MLGYGVERWCSLLVLAFSSCFLVHSQNVNKAQPWARATAELSLAFPKGVDCTLKLCAKRKLSPPKLWCLVFGQRDANINAMINDISKIYHCSWLMITAQNTAVILDSTNDLTTESICGRMSPELSGTLVLENWLRTHWCSHKKVKPPQT